MEETRGTVRLVEGAPFDVSTRGVTATLRRSDIEQAARAGDEPAELLLDVRRGQGADVEAHSVAVEWSQADLDRLLREAKTAEEVTIAFDGDEMAAAITAQADVEAHGLRDKVVVLTVVAVSALSTAGVAQAMPYAGSGGGAAATPAASVAAPAPAPAPATTIGGAGGGESIVAASPATTIGGAGPAPVEQVGVTPATTGATTAPAVPPQVEVRGEAAARTLPSAGGDSSLPSGEAVAVLGAAGIAIAAAGFAAAGTRRRPVRPA
jgi:2-oxoglutarate dehydrogenase E2 component (dihydrolipoamide succinyltransferase)